MNIEYPPIIEEAKSEDFTCVTFYPDLSKFKMDSLDDDIIGLFKRRAYDVAASTRGIKVYLNDSHIPIDNFEDYCKLYLKSNIDEAEYMNLIVEKSNPRWEIALCNSQMGFQQVSFVNGIATTKGGCHIDYISDQVIRHIRDSISKKLKSDHKIKSYDIKQNLWLFVNSIIENPTFDSQTKETLTSQPKTFGSKCQLSESFLKQITDSPIMDKLLEWNEYLEESQLEKLTQKKKSKNIRGKSSFDNANINQMLKIL
jgi:DNA topoisomerase-2